MIHYNMSMSDYLASPAIGSSHLKQILSSPRDFLAYRTRPKQDTRATELGTAVHTLILEPDEFPSRYALQPEDWGPRNKGVGYKMWQEFKETNRDKICIGWEDSQLIYQVNESCDAHRGLNRIIRDIGGKSEVTAFTAPGDVQLKARADFLGNDGIIWDVKTTSKGVSDRDIWKTINFWGYHFQAAHHTHVLNEAGADIKGFGWIFVDLDSPSVNIVTRRCSDDLILRGEDDFYHALDLLHKCTENVEWPARYDDDILEISEGEWT